VSKERILFVLDALYVGGTETHVLGLAKELMEKNVFVAIVARKEGSLLKSFEALNCPIHHIDFPRTLKLEKMHEKNLVEKIEEIIESEKITLVHFHQTPSGYLSGKAAKNKEIPTIFTVHGTYYPNHEIRMLLEFTHTVICVSPPLKEYIQSFGIKTTYLVPNGINLAEYPLNKTYEELKKELKIPKESIVVVYASRMAWAKAKVCTMFLRACKDLKINVLPNLHVIVVGGGSRLNDIKNLAQYIEQLGNNSFVHIVGEQKNMHAYYSIADCVVGTGRVALEAMASNKTVLAVGNHGYFGIVTKENLDEAWAHYFGDHGSTMPSSRHTIRDNLKKVLVDKEFLKLNGLQSREIIEEKFNIQKIADEMIKIYSETVKGGT